nr:integrase, catalytic region, zinc finger, CCHC-type, peptidase aspartic, catalytic [Tanacetum cinerariifolium]
MFTTVGHRWKPTGRTFSLVENVCPLTRIATTTIVPPKEPIPIASNIDKPVIALVYFRKSKAAKKVPVVQIVLWYLDSGCSKHMTGDRTQLINFVQKFLGAIKFRNDHVAKIMGYGDYKIWNVTISRQNGVVERRNRTLIEAARTMLIYAQASLFLWEEAMAIADNLGKLQPKADIRIFIGYAPNKKAFQIYNRRSRRIVKTIHVDFDELTAMASEQISSGPALYEMTPATINSGLVQKPSSSTPYVPPSRND